jgi:hypothetical protein
LIEQTDVMIRNPLNTPYLEYGKKETNNIGGDLKKNIMKEMKRTFIKFKRCIQQMFKNVK